MHVQIGSAALVTYTPGSSVEVVPLLRVSGCLVEWCMSQSKSAAVVEGHLVAVGVRERESAAERPVDGR